MTHRFVQTGVVLVVGALASACLPDAPGDAPVTLAVEVSGAGRGSVVFGRCPLPSGTVPPQQIERCSASCTVDTLGGLFPFRSCSSTCDLIAVAEGVRYCLRAIPNEGSVFESFSENCAKAGDLAANEAAFVLATHTRLSPRFVCRVRFGLRTPTTDGGPALDAGDAAADAETDAPTIDRSDAATPDAAPDAAPDATPDATTDVADAPVDGRADASVDRPGEESGVMTACAIRTMPGACTPGVDPGCDIVDVSIGSGSQSSVCAVFADGSVRCWSRTGMGYFLGNGTATGCPAPGIVRGLTGVTRVVQGNESLCALRPGEAMPVWCWGFNGARQFGVDTPISSLVPIATPIPMGSLSVGGGSGFSLSGTGARVVTAWGNNQYGQLGDGTTSALPGVAPHPVALGEVRQIVVEPVRGRTACAVMLGGEVRCWGSGQVGHFGTAITPLTSTTSSLTPITVPGITNVREMQISSRFACAVKLDDTLWCWGLGNDAMMMGAGLTPTQVLDRVAEVAVSPLVVCARRTDGTVWCWGDAGAVGNGGPAGTLVPSPVELTGIGGVRRIFAGFHTRCALLRSSGADLRCWGEAPGFGASSAATPTPVMW